MDAPVEPELLEDAIAFAHRAGELTLRHFGSSDLEVEHKGDGSPVTIADRGAERLLREAIAKKYPDDGVLGEEEPESPGTSGRRWIIDPIDGTKAFIHGVPLYTNLVALEDRNGIAIGVINIPALGETVAAGRGLGCYLNGSLAHVSSRTELSGSYLTCSGLSGWTDSSLIDIRSAGVEIRTWGDGYGYAMVATGRAEAMFDAVAELYDLAPMPVIITEAGGRFTDLGARQGPGGGSGLATNGLLHDAMLTLLAQNQA